MTDLLVKLVRESQKSGAVDVQHFLVRDAMEFGIPIRVGNSSELSIPEPSVNLTSGRKAAGHAKGRIRIVEN